MESIKSTIENILKITNEITNTARYVNRDSHKRKEISVESLAMIERLSEGSGKLRSYFNDIIKILHESQKSIINNSNEFKSNVDTYTEVITNLRNIKNTLNSLEDGIYKLINTIDVIKNDTDEIFILALNASIEKSCPASLVTPLKLHLAANAHVRPPTRALAAPLSGVL